MANNILKFQYEDKQRKIKTNGKFEIKNKTETAAELYIYGDIVSSEWAKWDSTDVAPQDIQDFLKQLDGMTEIKIFINSGGGDVFAGLAIYHTLKRHPANKIVTVDGVAASISSVIMLCGDTKIVPSTAQIMIHNPWTFAMGNAKEFRKLADDLDTITESLINVYMDNVKDGVTIEQIKEMMDAEKWMTGTEASKYFDIETKELAAAACATGLFDLYKNAPVGITKAAIEDEPPAPPAAPETPEGTPAPTTPAEDKKAEEKARAKAILQLHLVQ